MSLLRSASVVSLFTLASRVTGLARELLVAALFGASALTDAFNVAFRIPNLFRRLFAEGAFSQAFVPVLAATRAEQGDAATREAVDQVATVLAWVLLLFSVLGVMAAPVLVWLLASGLQQGPGYDAAVQVGVLQAHGGLREQLLGLAPQLALHAGHAGQVLQGRVARVGALGGLEARQPGAIDRVQAGPFERLHQAHLQGRIEAILLTHFHSDHIGDLGELQLQTWAGGRPAPLAVPAW